jgi:hypothetical protein
MHQEGSFLLLPPPPLSPCMGPPTHATPCTGSFRQHAITRGFSASAEDAEALRNAEKMIELMATSPQMQQLMMATMPPAARNPETIKMLLQVRERGGGGSRRKGGERERGRETGKREREMGGWRIARLEKDRGSSEVWVEGRKGPRSKPPTHALGLEFLCSRNALSSLYGVEGLFIKLGRCRAHILRPSETYITPFRTQVHIGVCDMPLEFQGSPCSGLFMAAAKLGGPKSEPRLGLVLNY